MGMKPAGTPEEFAQAVNDEVKAEMARSVAYDSNRKLASEMGVSGDYVNRRVANKTAWDMHDLEVLGAIFDLDPEVFVDRAVRTLIERGMRPEPGDGNATVTELPRPKPPRNPATARKAARDNPKKRS